MDLDSVSQIIISLVGALGGFSLIKFLFFRKSEKRLKNLENDEKELDILKKLIESLNLRIEQQDKKIQELNDKVDKLYDENHMLEAQKTELLQRNAMLELHLKEAQHNVCVRPDDECLKRMPPREYCRLKLLANGRYDKYYNKEDIKEDTEQNKPLNEEENETAGN